MTGVDTTRTTMDASMIIVGEPRTPTLLIDGKACAAMLGISHRTLLRLVDRGEAPTPVKLGRLTRWRAADVLAYVNGLGHHACGAGGLPRRALPPDA
jgi:predicted DNA-binding transcriptional regulator AlpA